MMVRRSAALVLLGAAALMVAAGCGQTTVAALDSGAQSHGTIGLAMPSKTQTRWISDGDSMVKQFTLLGYRTEMQYADDNPQTQVSQIQAMLDHGDRALVIGAVDGTALKGVLANAAAKHVPVISYDRLIRDSPNVDYYATFDNFKVGVLQASYLVDTLGLAAGKGPFDIEVFAGSPDDNNATVFYNGAMSVLGPYLASGKLVVPSGQTAFTQVATKAWDGKAAQQRMTTLLAGPDAGKTLAAVLAPNDGLARGILDALKSSGYGTAKPLPATTGQDAELDSVKLVAAGQQGMTVYKDTRELAKVAVEMTNMLLSGETPEVNDTTQYNNGVKVVPTFLLQPIAVTKANYQRVLVDGGYYTAAQIGG